MMRRVPPGGMMAAALLAALATPYACAQAGHSGVGAPLATESHTPATAAAQPSSPTSPDAAAETLDKTEGGLTFLPLLQPTDGVPVQSAREAAAWEPDVPTDAQATLLDRAAAVIDGEVVLDSDIREQQHFAVFEPFRVPGGTYTPLEAMQQIVNRTLLLHQMREQKLVPPPSDAAVEEQINDLRKHLPACAAYDCESAPGWRRFLAAQGFTEQGLHERWKSRMQILSFIEVRFRTGIRIAKPEIEKYYQDQLVPQFAARKLPPPPLAKVSDRIDEVLLQQHVNLLLADYLRSLKDAGNVQILEPAYNQLGKTAAASNNQNPEQNPAQNPAQQPSPAPPDNSGGVE